MTERINYARNGIVEHDKRLYCNCFCDYCMVGRCEPENTVWSPYMPDGPINTTHWHRTNVVRRGELYRDMWRSSNINKKKVENRNKELPSDVYRFMKRNGIRPSTVPQNVPQHYIYQTKNQLYDTRKQLREEFDPEGDIPFPKPISCTSTTRCVAVLGPKAAQCQHNFDQTCSKTKPKHKCSLDCSEPFYARTSAYLGAQRCEHPGIVKRPKSQGSTWKI